MTNDQIKEIALANGHALMTMPDGTEDIHPHVYDFARALMGKKLNQIMAALEAMESDDNTLDMSAMLDMCQDVIERHINDLREVTND